MAAEVQNYWRGIRKGASRHLPFLAILFGLLLLIYTPLFPPGSVTSQITAGDAAQYVYLVNWGQYILVRQPWNYYELPLFFPQKGIGAYNEANPLMALATSPLRTLAGPVFSFNAQMLLTGLLCGAAAYAAAFVLTRHRRAALFAGAVFAGNGSMLLHMAGGHPNIVSPIFVPLTFLFYGLFREQRRTRDAVLCTLMLLLQFACSYYLGGILFIGLAVLWVADLARKKFRVDHSEWAFVASIAVMLAIVFAASAPYRELQDRLGQTRGLHEATQYSADLFGYFLPAYSEDAPRPLLGQTVATAIPWPQRMENARFFGYATWTLAVIALVQAARRWRHRESAPQDRMVLRLAVVAAIALLLSLGPYLWIGGRVTSIPLPFRLLYEIAPPIRFMRSTARFAILVSWFAAAASAVYLSRASWFNLTCPYRKSAMTALALIVLLVEFFPVHGPPHTTIDPAGRMALEAHPEFTRVSSAPLEEWRFLPDTATTFPTSPSGIKSGIYNHHFIETADAMWPYLDRHGLAMQAALGVEAIMVYGPEFLAAAEKNPWLEPMERWDGGGLYALHFSDAQAIAHVSGELTEIPEKPPLPESAEFPTNAPPEQRWVPTAWLWLDETIPSGEWRPLPWQQMQEEGFTHDDLQQLFLGSMAPRSCEEIGAVHVKLSLHNPGVDFTHVRAYWTTEENPTLDSDRRIDTFIRGGAREQTVTFDFLEAEDWNPGEQLSAIYFEFPTQPYPGQPLRIAEMRFSPP